ncbi:DUF6020 family protein [Bifidobacterium sp. ESL0784]|uniref:DUF6020 family protein n=1 Tax=Bifidobacterium sp. ESL0784 TaxID=2983231 RepID=UPI0023FA34CD|nr:DUF6020 family protein [Bifidobacterium sp. ESL0784]MDF7640755.1 DUF6020 family protein [Bifidobacterium sp. ESL0784]
MEQGEVKSGLVAKMSSESDSGIKKYIVPIVSLLAATLILVFVVPGLGVVEQAVGLHAILNNAINSVASAGALATFAAWLVFFMLYWKGAQAISRRPLRESCIFAVVSLLLSATVCFTGTWATVDGEHTGFPWYSSGTYPFGRPSFTFFFTIRLIAIGSLLLMAWALIADALGRRRNNGIRAFQASNENPETKTSGFVKTMKRYVPSLRLNVRSVAIYTALVTICWLPILYINGPVIVNIDTVLQLIQGKGSRIWDPMTMQWLDGYVLQDHHPVFDTLIYVGFDRLGLLLGHEVVGLQILTVLQAIVTAFAVVLSLAWCFSRVKNIPALVQVCAVAFIIFVPTFSTVSTVIVKDSTWAPIFLLWAIAFAEFIYRKQSQKPVSWKFIILFVVLAIFAGLTKKPSIYITTGATFIVLIFMSGRFKTLVATLVPAGICLVLIPGLLFPAMHIAPGGVQEPLSIPIQQVTKVLIDHQDQLSQKDLRTISKVLDIKEAKKNWNPLSADFAKHYGYKPSSTKADRSAFEKLWIALAFRYPGSYINAISYVRTPFVLGQTYYQTGPVRCGWDGAGTNHVKVLPEYKDCALSKQQEHLGKPFVNVMNHVPPFSLLGAEVLYVVWVPLLALALVIVRKRWKSLLYFAPVLMQLLVQFMVPSYQNRYTLGLLFTVFLTLAIPFLSCGHSAEKTDMAKGTVEAGEAQPDQTVRQNG